MSDPDASRVSQKRYCLCNNTIYEHSPDCVLVKEVAALTQQVERLQQSLNLCEVHTPDLWEGDGSCVICEAVHQSDKLEQAEAEVARLRGEVTHLHRLYTDALAELAKHGKSQKAHSL